MQWTHLVRVGKIVGGSALAAVAIAGGAYAASRGSTAVSNSKVGSSAAVAARPAAAATETANHTCPNAGSAGNAGQTSAA